MAPNNPKVPLAPVYDVLIEPASMYKIVNIPESLPAPIGDANWELPASATQCSAALISPDSRLLPT